MAVTDTEQLYFKQGTLTFSAQAMGDGPIVLCLHGFPDNAGSYRHQLPAFAEAGYRAISLTLRGYEPSSIPIDGDYTMETIATDILAVIDSLDIGPVHLVGHDWGAAVGWALAGKYPQHILSFFALSVPNLSAFSKAIKEDQAQYKMSNYARLFQLRGIPEWVIKRKNLEIFRKNCWYLSSEEEKQAYIDLYKEKRALTCTLNWYRRNWSRMKKLALQFKNEAISVPTTYIWGNKDSSVGRFAAEQTASYMKGAYQFIELEASHWLIQEKKKAVWQALSKHFKK